MNTILFRLRGNKKLVDIHAHILHGVDDGAETMEESMRLLEIASNEGITDIIATPHAYSPQFNVPKEKVLEQLALLTKEIELRNLDIQVHAGQELRLMDILPLKIKAEEGLSLAGSRYILLELPSSGIPGYTVNIIQQLLNLDKIPIIAHPERNRAIAQKPEYLERLIRHGALAQITAGSLSGHFGKNIQKLSVQLTQANLIHTYGSDVHNLAARPALFNEGLDYLEKRKLHDYVDILLENNARILTNEPLIQLEPKKVVEKKWWNIATS